MTTYKVYLGEAQNYATYDIFQAKTWRINAHGVSFEGHNGLVVRYYVHGSYWKIETLEEKQ